MLLVQYIIDIIVQTGVLSIVTIWRIGVIGVTGDWRIGGNWSIYYIIIYINSIMVLAHSETF